MTSIIVPLLFVAAQAHAQLPDATLTSPSSSVTNEDMHLIQSSPALQANAIVAPTTNESVESMSQVVETAYDEVRPARVQGSMHFRSPGENTTIANLSFSEISASDQIAIDDRIISSEWELNSSATLYSLRVAYGLTDTSALFLDGGYLKSQIGFEGYTSSSRKGLRDFEFGYIGRSANDRRAWLYGASIAGSPESFGTRAYNSANGFSGATTLRGYVGYERNLRKSLAGIHFSSQTMMGNYKSLYYDGDMTDVASLGDLSAYYEFPIAKNVGFGVKAGAALFSLDDNSNAYHASATTSFDVMDDTQIRLEAEGTTAGFHSHDGSGATSRVTGTLSKAL